MATKKSTPKKTPTKTISVVEVKKAAPVDDRKSVKALVPFYDGDINGYRFKGDVWKSTPERAKALQVHGLVIVL